jgi:hypothetical protein
VVRPKKTWWRHLQPGRQDVLVDLPNLTDPNDMNPIIAVEYRMLGD